MQRLSTARHGTFGSYLCDALYEGSANAVACLPAPRAYDACWIFSFFFLGGFHFFFVKNNLSKPARR
jgi:hypothetical protein